MAAYFERHGYAIARFTCLGLDDDRVMARISRSSLVAAARAATAPESQALFISCTALRAASVAAEIEQAIGRPVITSNLATAWLSLRLCGDEVARPECGRLMTAPVPARAA
jgi:maleate isomerase